MTGSADVGTDCTEKVVVCKDTTMLARPQSDDELKTMSLAVPAPVVGSLFHPWRPKIRAVPVVLAIVRYRIPQ